MPVVVCTAASVWAVAAGKLQGGVRVAVYSALLDCIALSLLLQVLEDLLAENDGVLDVWHLLGLSYYSGGMLDEAAEVCKTGMQLMKKQQVGPDEGIALAFDDLHSAISEAQAAAQS